MSTDYDEPRNASTADENPLDVPIGRREVLAALGLTAAGAAGVAGYGAVTNTDSDETGVAADGDGPQSGAAGNTSEDYDSGTPGEDEPYDDTTEPEDGYGEETDTPDDGGQSGPVEAPADTELFDYSEDTIRDYLQPKDDGDHWEIYPDSSAFIGERVVKGSILDDDYGWVSDADADSSHGTLVTPGLHKEDYVVPFITDAEFLADVDWEMEVIEESGSDIVEYTGEVPRTELHEIDSGVFLGAMDLSLWFGYRTISLLLDGPDELDHRLIVNDTNSS